MDGGGPVIIKVAGKSLPNGTDPINMSGGDINVNPLISAIAPLAEGPRWFDRLYAREPNLMKVVLQPGASS